jgi:chromate transporter
LHPLTEIAVVFLRLGATAFGGPAVHVAMMEEELVRRRRWVSSERFLDLFGASNLIPGPGSTELGIFLGYERAGIPGLLVAGVCFILPAALLTGLLAWAYLHWGARPEIAQVLQGVKPVVIAVVAQAIVLLLPKALKRSWLLGAVGAASLVAGVLGVSPLSVLVGAGLLTVIARSLRQGPDARAAILLDLGEAGRLLAPEAHAAAAPNALGVFLAFLKIGAVSFGGGYVLVAFLRSDFVLTRHWLTEGQLLDAVAVGQLTPGPVFTTATFIGYLLFGTTGAVLATLGIFLPGFVLVGATRPLLARLRRSPVLAGFLDGTNVAAVSLMGVATIGLARAAIVDVPTLVIGGVAAVLHMRFKVASTWLVLGGALTAFVLGRL